MAVQMKICHSHSHFNSQLGKLNPLIYMKQKNPLIQLIEEQIDPDDLKEQIDPVEEEQIDPWRRRTMKLMMD